MSIVWLIVGAFIGWNVPQPQWAKDFKASIVAKIKGLFTK